MKKFNELTASEAITLYKELDLKTEANLIFENNKDKDLETLSWPWNRPPKAWEHSSYAYGFIAESGPSSESLSINDARNIPPDESLKNSRLTISLDYLRVFDYPGRGVHRVLFKFNARNQFDSSGEEELIFNQTFAIQEGQRAPISGYPIFIGLNTRKEFVQFNVDIINVSNDNDEKVLNTMNSGVFTNGLKLVGTVNPAIPVVTEYAKGITKMIASRNKNREVIAPKMALYFGASPGRMKLAKGMYIAVQMSRPDEFDWSKWTFNRNFGTLQSSDGNHTDLPYNYFIFSVSETN